MSQSMNELLLVPHELLVPARGRRREIKNYHEISFLAAAVVKNILDVPGLTNNPLPHDVVLVLQKQTILH